MDDLKMKEALRSMTTAHMLEDVKEKGMAVIENVATINLLENGMSAVVIVGEELIRIDNENGRLVVNYSLTDYEFHEGNIFLEDSDTPMS